MRMPWPHESSSGRRAPANATGLAVGAVPKPGWEWNHNPDSTKWSAG
ncbi:hypothetical protein SAMN05216481_11695 [Streptomyces radiopugnans]|uniref:Uncharacterized protein n=1 Tax=Streptomyces radiopugnans TaxID=403935 RepID=A0A1H9J7E2_9ACTN|nr:hypothetical protein SAMN05216481_11695 [Streptomyces radiopugnans]